MPNEIHDTANLGPGTTIGHYSVVASNVEIGKDCYIGHHVVIHPDTVIGDQCVIDDRSVVGKLPLRSAAMAIEPGTDLPPLAIGDGAILGTSAIVFRGSSIGSESLIADLASVREQTHIGDKTIIGRGTAIENHVSIGHRCKVEAGCFICAFSTIGDDCFVAPEVTFTNDSFLGRTEGRKRAFEGPTLDRGARIGANATILPGRHLDQDALAAAGAVVTRDVAARVVVVGVPAREKGNVPSEQWVDNG